MEPGCRVRSNRREIERLRDRYGGRVARWREYPPAHHRFNTGHDLTVLPWRGHDHDLLRTIAERDARGLGHRGSAAAYLGNVRRRVDHIIYLDPTLQAGMAGQLPFVAVTNFAKVARHHASNSTPFDVRPDGRRVGDDAAYAGDRPRRRRALPVRGRSTGRRERI